MQPYVLYRFLLYGYSSNLSMSISVVQTPFLLLQCLRVFSREFCDSVNFIILLYKYHKIFSTFIILHVICQLLKHACVLLNTVLSLFLIPFFYYCHANIAIFKDIKLPALSIFLILFISS